MTISEPRHRSAPSIPAPVTALRKFAELPGPPGIPLLGNMLQIDPVHYHQAMEDWAEKYGLYFRVRIGRKQMLVLSDSAAIAGILRNRPDALRRSPRVTAPLNELGARGLFTAEGEDWRTQRKLVMRAFAPEVVRNFFPVLSAMTERLRKRWHTAVRAGHEVNLLRDLKAFALDITVSLAMGQDINTLEHDDNPLQRDIDLIFRRVGGRITSPVQYWHYIRLASDREADAAAERVSQAVKGFIEQTRKRMEEQPHLRDKPTNMLEALVAARDEPDSGFTDKDVIGNAITIVFAGEDTTSNTTAWLLYLIARHPEVAARLQAEVDAVAGSDPVLQQFSLLDALPYADAATSEAIRLKPVIPIQTMETNQEMQIGDVLVPQGTLVMALFRQSSRMTCHFTDPDMFIPERWLDGGSVDTNGIGGQVFPFGGGPRFCPGRYLALAEIKMIVSMLIRNFTMEPDASAPPVQESFAFTVSPDAMPIRLVERPRKKERS